MRRIFSFALALLLLCPCIEAQQKEVMAVADKVEQLRKALIDPNRATLEKLTTPQLSYGHSTGLLQDQAAFIEALVSGSSDFVTISLSDQTISVVGNTAVVRHKLNGTNNDGGKPGVVKIAIMLVYVKQHNDWKLLARQAVKI